MGFCRSPKASRRQLIFAAATLFPIASLAHADTTANWIAAGSGNWTTAANWSTSPNYPDNGTPSGVNYQATIGQLGTAPYTVTLDSSISVNSLRLSSANATLSQTAGTLTLGSLTITAGTYQLGTNAILADSNSGDFVSLSAGATLVNGGTINSDIAGEPVNMSFGGSQVAFTNNSLAEATNGGTLSMNSGSWANAIGGTLSAIGSSKLVLGGNWNNAGMITTSGAATLNLAGNFTTAGMGSVSPSSDTTVNITPGGLLDNSGATLPIASQTGTWQLNGGEISGGIISESAAEPLHILNGYLVGVRISGTDLNLDATGAALTVMNGITVDSHNINLTGNSSSLTFDGASQAIDQLTITGAPVNPALIPDIVLGNSHSAGAVTLTLGANTTVQGNIAINNNPNNSGNTLVNNGTISANISNQTVSINPTNFTNNGLAQATNGGTLAINSSAWTNSVGGTISAVNSTLTLAGNWTNAGLITAQNSTVNVIGGSAVNTGTTVIANSTIDFGGTFTPQLLNAFSFGSNKINISGNLTLNSTAYVLPPGTGPFSINGGTINGGLLAPSLLLMNGRTFHAQDAAATATLYDTRLVGTDINVDGANAVLDEYAYGAWTWDGLSMPGEAVNLSGSGAKINIGGSPHINNLNINATGGNNVIFVGDSHNSTASPGFGTHAVLNGGALIASYGTSQQIIYSNGTFNATNQPLDLRNVAFYNGGTINIAADQQLIVESTSLLNNSPTGVINLAPGSTLSAPGGLSLLYGTLHAAGTINGNLNLATSSIPQQLAFNLGGTVAGSGFDSLSLNGNLSLGSDLNLNFTNGFQTAVTSGESFQLVSVNGGSISGSFANVANGGRLQTADNYGSFQVNYGAGPNANQIVLSNYQPSSATTIKWNAVLPNPSGAWADGGYWSFYQIPQNGSPAGAHYQVTIDEQATQPYSVRFDTTATVDSLTLNSANATLNQTNGILTVGALNIQAGTYNLNATSLDGTLSGGAAGATVTVGPAGRFSIANGTLDHLTFSGTDLTFPTNQGSLIISGGLNLGGKTLYSTGNDSRISFNGTDQLIDGLNIHSQAATVNNQTQLLVPGNISTSSDYTLTLGTNATIDGSFIIESGTSDDNGTLVNNGTINANESGPTSAIGTPTLNNGGLIEATNHGALQVGVIEYIGGGFLTNAAASWINTSTGILKADNATLSLSGIWVNLGAVNAASASTLNLAGSWVNTGSINVTGGSTVNLGGTFTAADLANVTVSSDSTANFTGTLDNTNNVLLRTLGTWNLNGGTIHSGTISFASPQFLHIKNGTLDAVHITGGDLNEDGAAASLALLNGISIDTHTLNIVGSAASTTIDGSSQTVDNLTIHAMATTATAQQALYLGGPNSLAAIVVTLGPAATVRGNVVVNNNPLRGGNTLINNGTISADTAGQSLAINPSNFTNNSTAQAINGGILAINAANWTNAATGTISANASTLTFTGNWSNAGSVSLIAGSTLNLGGTFAVTGIGNLSLSADSAVNITGTLDNSAGGVTTKMLHLNPSTGSWNLTSTGLIQNGTIFATSPQQLNVAGGTLSSSSLAAGSAIGVNNSTANWTGIWTNFGTISSSNAILNFGVSPTQLATTTNSGTINAANSSLNIWGTLSNSGSVTAAATANNGTITLTGGTANLGALSGTGSIVISTGANQSSTLVRQSKLTVNGVLAVSPHSNTSPSSATVSTLNTLVVAGAAGGWTGRIDLANNDIIIQSGNLAALADQLHQGFAKGAWTGPGIYSSAASQDTRHLTALGYRTGGNPFDGVTTTSQSVIIKYTYYGDADLDGTVTGADYQQIDNGFGLHLTGWSNGDFNYDGVVNGSDFALIDNTFNQITATGAASLALLASPADIFTTPTTSTVPEPVCTELLTLTAVAPLLKRRRLISPSDRPY